MKKKNVAGLLLRTDSLINLDSPIIKTILQIIRSVILIQDESSKYEQYAVMIASANIISRSTSSLVEVIFHSIYTSLSNKYDWNPIDSEYVTHSYLSLTMEEVIELLAEDTEEERAEKAAFILTHQ